MDGRKFVESEGEQMRRLSIREEKGTVDRLKGDARDRVRVRGEKRVVGERVRWKHDRSRVGKQEEAMSAMSSFISEGVLRDDPSPG